MVWIDDAVATTGGGDYSDDDYPDDAEVIASEIELDWARQLRCARSRQ